MRTALSADPAPTEYGFDQADFERVRGLIRAHAGISLLPGKQAMVYGRLARRLRETGHGSVGAYLQWLEAAEGSAAGQERQAFVNALTTNLTSFFREPHHFDLLRGELTARAPAPLRIWCAAASTGEEPYTLAITALEALGARPDMSIIASDIDTRVLATAAAGIYPADSRGLTPDCRRRHFLRGTGAQRGLMRVKEALARLVEFRRLNLVDDHWALGAPLDIVFCRNVLIYFDHATQHRVLARLHAVMRPGGLLFLGHAENITGMDGQFRLQGRTVYVRL